MKSDFTLLIISAVLYLKLLITHHALLLCCSVSCVNVMLWFYEAETVSTTQSSRSDLH